VLEPLLQARHVIGPAGFPRQADRFGKEILGIAVVARGRGGRITSYISV